MSSVEPSPNPSEREALSQLLETPPSSMMKRDKETGEWVPLNDFGRISGNVEAVDKAIASLQGLLTAIGAPHRPDADWAEVKKVLVVAMRVIESKSGDGSTPQTLSPAPRGEPK